MEDTKITFKTAKLAKEKGFKKVKCDYYFDKSSNIQKEIGIDNLHRDGNFNKIAVPTQSLLAKWLREEHNIDVWCTPYLDDKKKEYNYMIVNRNIDIYDLISGNEYNTYEEAYEIGLQEALKLI